MELDLNCVDAFVETSEELLMFEDIGVRRCDIVCVQLLVLFNIRYHYYPHEFVNFKRAYR